MALFFPFILTNLMTSYLATLALLCLHLLLIFDNKTNQEVKAANIVSRIPLHSLQPYDTAQLKLPICTPRYYVNCNC